MITVNLGEIEWNRRNVEQYHRDRELFLELILLSMNFTCGETGRDQEILSIQYKNSIDKDCNILLDDEQIQIAMEYHKSQAITDDVKIRLDYFQLICRALHDLLIRD
jgi:hypothetical protein